jgi:sulfur-carrier protein
MIVHVQLFAIAREKAGQDHIEIELPNGSRLADLRAALAQSVPDLAPNIGQMLFAIEQQYANEQTPLADGTEVACIPPVSGG